jgi:hypothetical protein
MKVKKEPKIRMGAARRNLFLRLKMKTNPSDPKGEVSNFKASFKNQADRFFIWTAMFSRLSERKFFFRKNRFFSDKKS